MTTTGQVLEPWKGTAATLFNPYLNLSQISNVARQQSVRTRILTPTRHSRAPPESIVTGGNLKLTSSESPVRPKSKHFPSPNSTEEVSIYVQQMVHNQFCGRSGTPSDVRYDEQKIFRTNSQSKNRNNNGKRITSSKKQSRVSDYALDEFFNTTDEQISRVASMIPGRDSILSENYSWGESPRHKTNMGERVTLADMCHIASNVGDKMSQSKEKVGLEAIRGFRLPSARLTYEPYEHHPMEAALVLGQPVVNDPVRLSDVLADENFAKEQMIEIVSNDTLDDRASRTSRTHLKSTTSMGTKINELKDWRGKISHPNLPDVRSQLRRQYSASVISPQRPCTAVSNLSKSRPQSSGVHINETQKDDIPIQSTNNAVYPPMNSALKNQSGSKQRQRNYPLNVRIDENIIQQDNDQNTITNDTVTIDNIQDPEKLIDPPALSLLSGSNDEQLQANNVIHRPTPNTFSTGDSKRPAQLSPNSMLQKRTYKLIPGSSKQIYRTTTTESNQNTNNNQKNEQFSQLTLSQLELLEQYDPAVSARIGVPFIPVQMLVRPRDAQQSGKRSIQEIQRGYPKRNGQPVFQPPTNRNTNSLIDIAQTLQLTKSKRIPVERQTTFEKPENEAAVEESIQIKSIENPNRLAITFYTPTEQQSLVKHTNSTRTSSKAYPSQLDDISIYHNIISQYNENYDRDNERIENNLSVINLRTQQEVDQTHRPERLFQRRLVFPTSIVTNATSNSSSLRTFKQRGRPIPSVFLTEDPDEYNHSLSIYRQAKSEADVKRSFKGFADQSFQRKLSADERKRREEQQKAAIKIQRAYREHLIRRKQIESRRPSTAKTRERDLNHRRILSAKRAQQVEQQIIEQIKIRDENKQLRQMIEDTGPSLQIFASFNKVDVIFSKATLNRAATCIQRWWRGFIIRHRLNNFKNEVSNFGFTWTDFIARYREIIQRIPTIRQSDSKQFIFNLDQARQFLTFEKKLTIIYNALSFNGKLEEDELEKYFESCDLSATPNEIKTALKSVLKHHTHKLNDPLTKDIVFDVIYYIYPPAATGLKTSRKSTWVRPIIDGEDESAIKGTPFLEPIDLGVVYKFLGKQ